MSDLKTNLEQILQEKQSKIIPENIKKDTQIFDVVGTYNGDGQVKLFETEDEMQADAKAKEGDLAVVYLNKFVEIQPDYFYQYISCPETVVLDTAITETDYIQAGMININYSPTSFTIIGASTEDITYTSSDGITYIRTDTLGNPIQAQFFVIDQYYWKSFLPNFILGQQITFRGFYLYSNSQWNYAPTDLTLNAEWQLLPNTKAYGSNGVYTGTIELYNHLSMYDIHRYLMNDTPNDEGYNSILINNLTTEQIGVSKFKSFDVVNTFTNNISANITGKNMTSDAQSLLYFFDDFIIDYDKNIGYRLANTNDGNLCMLGYNFNDNTVSILGSINLPSARPDITKLYSSNSNFTKFSLLHDDYFYEFDLTTKSFILLDTIQYSGNNILNINLDDGYIIYIDKPNPNIMKKSFGEEPTILLTDNDAATYGNICFSKNWIVYGITDSYDARKLYNLKSNKSFIINFPFNSNFLEVISDDIDNIIVLAASTQIENNKVYVIKDEKILYTLDTYTDDGDIALRNTIIKNNKLLLNNLLVDMTNGTFEKIVNMNYTPCIVTNYQDGNYKYYNFNINSNFPNICECQAIELYDNIYTGNYFLIVSNLYDTSIEGVIKADLANIGVLTEEEYNTALSTAKEIEGSE